MPWALTARASASTAPAAPAHHHHRHGGPMKFILTSRVLMARTSASAAPAAPAHPLINGMLGPVRVIHMPWVLTARASASAAPAAPTHPLINGMLALWGSSTCRGCSWPARPPRRYRSHLLTIIFGMLVPVRVMHMPWALMARASASAAPAEPSHPHLHRHVGPCGGHAHAMGAHGPLVRLGGAGCTYSPSHELHVGPVGDMHMAWMLMARVSASAALAAPSHPLIIIGMLALWGSSTCRGCLWPARRPRRRRPNLLTLIFIGMLAL